MNTFPMIGNCPWILYVKFVGVIVIVPLHGAQFDNVVLKVSIGVEPAVPILNCTVSLQPAVFVPITVYKVPAHKPLILFPTIAGITDGLIVYTIFGTLFIVAVPSQPAPQLAFVVDAVSIAVDGKFTKVNVFETVQLFTSDAITVYVPVPKLLNVPIVDWVGVHVDPIGLWIVYVIVLVPPTAKMVAEPSHPGEHDGLDWETILTTEGPAGVDKLITTLPEHEFPSFTKTV